MFKSLIDFVFPTACADCQNPASPLCDDCLPEFSVNVSSFEGRPVWYAIEYNESIAKLLSAYKDQSRTALVPFLVPGLHGVIAEALATVGPCVVCVPPRNSSNYKKRGFDPVFKLITSFNFPESTKLTRSTLRFQRVISDQRTLDKIQRKSNVADSMVAIAGSGRALIVDDVMTTGSTLKECVRALTVAGFEVVGSCVLAKRIL
jgi:predicted amidophosphoribosyltransferase